MAKNKKSKSNGIGLIAAFVLVVAVVYVITSLALCVRAGAPVWNPLKWRTAGTAQTEPGGDVGDVGDVPELTPGEYAAIDENGNLMREGVIYTMPESLVFIGDNTIQTKAGARAATAAEKLNVGKSVTVTATVTPDNATDKRVTWSSDNPGVNVAPLSEGSNIAVVTLVSNAATVFSESAATITCKSVSNPAKLSICSVSRLATTDEIEFIADGANCPALSYNDDFTPTARIELKGGISAVRVGEVANISVSIIPANTAEFINCINAQLNVENINFDFSDYATFEAAPEFNGIYDAVLILSPYDMFCGDSSVNCDKFNNAFLRACKDTYNGLSFPVEVYVNADYIFNGVKFGSFTQKIYYNRIDFDALWVEVGGVQIGGGDIVVTP